MDGRREELKSKFNHQSLMSECLVNCDVSSLLNGSHSFLSNKTQNFQDLRFPYPADFKVLNTSTIHKNLQKINCYVSFLGGKGYLRRGLTGDRAHLLGPQSMPGRFKQVGSIPPPPLPKMCVFGVAQQVWEGEGPTQFALGPTPVSLSDQLSLQVPGSHSSPLLSPNYFYYLAETLLISVECHES